MTAYRTLRGDGADSFVEKKSRFLGAAVPVHSVEEAQAVVARFKKRYWDARHNVSAYVLRGGQQHCSDDGEPQGTAGVPVLNVLLKSGVTDAAVVVTRYFGGVLLGAGGLVRAYTHAASLALRAAGIVEMRPCLRLRLSCTYSQYGRVAALLPAAGAVVDGEDFTDIVSISCRLAPEKLDALKAGLADATGGTVAPQICGEDSFAVEIESASS